MHAKLKNNKNQMHAKIQIPDWIFKSNFKLIKWKRNNRNYQIWYYQHCALQNYDNYFFSNYFRSAILFVNHFIESFSFFLHPQIQIQQGQYQLPTTTHLTGRPLLLFFAWEYLVPLHQWLSLFMLKQKKSDLLNIQIILKNKEKSALSNLVNLWPC